MKAAFNFLIFLIVLAFGAIATKPSDEACRDQVAHTYADQVPGGPLIEGVISAGSRYIFQVQDHIFFKEVINSFTGDRVAIGLFGNVILYK